YAEQEFFSGATRTQVEDPTFTTPPTSTAALVAFETPINQSDNYAERVTALFMPAVTGDYVFFLASDDDTDLFLSTDAKAANKQSIAMEAGWSNSRNWNTTGGGGSIVGDKRSDQYGGNTWPGAPTIHLTAGTK